MKSLLFMGPKPVDMSLVNARASRINQHSWSFLAPWLPVHLPGKGLAQIWSCHVLCIASLLHLMQMHQGHKPSVAHAHIAEPCSKQTICCLHCTTLGKHQSPRASLVLAANHCNLSWPVPS